MFRSNHVILMAGGLGLRLRPFTNSVPKPLLKVGNKPVLENILENFILHGFKDFSVSVNYRAEDIESYFGNGERWDVNIRYIRENEPLGTAGSLKLLGTRPKDPFFVMNGD